MGSIDTCSGIQFSGLKLHLVVKLASLQSVGMPMTCPLKARKTAPCFGFVFMSVHICSVGQCSMVISSRSTMSFMRKYFTLMCLVRLDLFFFFCIIKVMCY